MWKKLLTLGLEEDRASQDWTTQSLGLRGAENVRAVIKAKSKCLWASAGLAECLIDFGIKAEGIADGNWLNPGDIACSWYGSAEKILTLERTFLNIAAHVAGIATKTSEVVAVIKEAARGFVPPELRHTRKFLPAMRDVSIHAVLVGGGAKHRRDLSSSILIKENHIKVAGGISNAVKGAVKFKSLKVQVEVTDLEELAEAIAVRADSVLLDNFSPELVRKACEQAKGTGIFIEVSGGIDVANAGRYVIPGVHALSCGALTHSFKSADLSLKII